MIDTPLQRAARALMKSQSGVDDFDALDDEMQKGLLDDVRAVLEALREPSKAMIVEGVAERHEQGVPEAWSLATENIWRAMIDAALSE